MDTIINTITAILALAHRGPNYALAARIVETGAEEDVREAVRLTSAERASKVGAHDVLVSALTVFATQEEVLWNAEMLAEAKTLAVIEAKHEAKARAMVEAKRAESDAEARKWGHYVNAKRADGTHVNGRVKTNHLRPSQIEAHLRAHCAKKGWTFISVGSPCKAK